MCLCLSIIRGIITVLKLQSDGCARYVNLIELPLYMYLVVLQHVLEIQP